MIRAVWRPDDAALLTRLENEQLLGALWRLRTYPSAPPPHPRAAGLVHLLREDEAGERAARAARAGDLAPLRAAARPTPLAGRAPALLHHLALFEGRVARTLGPGAEARDAHLFGLAAWMALDAEEAYLDALADAAAGPALDARERREVARAIPLRGLDALGEAGRAGAAERTEEARLALRVLGDLRVATRLAFGESEHEPQHEDGDGAASRFFRRARAHRQAILDAATGALLEELEEANARSEPGDEQLALLAEAVETWRWADRDVELERFVVDQALPLAWELYNHRRWDPLRRLNDTLRAPVDSLAARLEADRAALLPYAARCAQMLVFRAELEARLDDQLAAAERAVALCETHRNGRLVFADLLAERALRTLSRAPLFQRGPAVEAARQDVQRAESLWPDGPRLQRAREALAREKPR
ncbi:MAG TPA: hypothetical protein RMH85_34895 [Polyangiaceae bacterium LLY-WYZ-15_(1-7)]|nr:hypothetical protein [Sandaracinus sp.]HJL05485.1 hypothetical protein [Polyangiaceae bacterium LLY-WYZ-15_(1-7)]HJL13726.1 hypothetical protein [Polyangiaceae bacterium LLY-WYZ-15_(1-7)]